MAVPIAIDFDRTLTDGSGDGWWENPHDESPNDEMVELVNGLYARGHTIIVYTARPESVRHETEMFLRKWNVRYHALRMNKLSTAVFIDDKAVHRDRALDWDVEGVEKFVYDDGWYDE